MGEWQPIETAPKDGTKVLVGRFTGNPKSDHDGLVEVDWYRQPRDKNGFNGFGRFNSSFWPPTHWMPLPEAPK